MSGLSFQKINYALRPAKSCERKMFCELFAGLARVAALDTYQYIGFGSIAFCDFALFHQRLGIKHMVSIEASDTEQKRFEFNRPYSCIKMKWGRASEMLPSCDWTKRSIIWLDYDIPISDEVLADIDFTVQSCRSGSIVLVTLDAEPDRGLEKTGSPKKRLEALTKRVGSTYIPPGLKPKNLSGWGTATVYRRIATNVVSEAIHKRNALVDPKKQVEYSQLINMHYADGARMMTIGGIIANPQDRDSFAAAGVERLQFIRQSDEAFEIRTPILTTRELKFLDERLPKIQKGTTHHSWLPRSEVEKYGKLYRYFPSFSEIESIG